MEPGRLAAGTFTDDTEMALALAESLLSHAYLDPVDLAQRFVQWYQAGPPDVGMHTSSVLRRVASGEPWEEAAAAVQRLNREAAGNGSVMRCWPVAAACWDQLDRLLDDSRLQSRITHPHSDCVEGCAFVNAAIYYMLRGILPAEAVARALSHVQIADSFQLTLRSAPGRRREELANTGWVRHTLESAVWGLRSTNSFEDAVVQVVNLGNDADSAGAVVGALAGAAYGLEGIPDRWRSVLQGEWPLGSGKRWDVDVLVDLADQLASVGG
jgi:ADP-ribosyl-[dinitrogen reductase] hydrolase